MMKRWLKSMLALCLCLCMMSGMALAQEAESAANAIALPEYAADRMIRQVAAVRDTVYILTTVGTQAELWRWREGMARAELCSDRLLYAPYYSSTELARQDAESRFGAEYADAHHAVTTIFAGDDKLYGYNSLERLVFEIEDTAEGLRCHDLMNVSWPGTDLYQSPLAVVKMQQWLFWLETDQNSRRYLPRLLAYNLDTGAVKQAVLPEITTICAYKDNQVLVVCKDEEEGFGLYSYDPATDLTACLGRVEGMNTLRAITYSAELDRVIYSNRNRIMGWRPEEGEIQLGFTPLTMNAQICVLGDRVIWRSTGDEENRLRISAISPDFTAEHDLAILSETSTFPSMDFYSLYPEVPFYSLGNAHMTSYTYGEYEEILAADAPDMLYLYGNSPAYQQLIENDRLLDLSAYPAIKAYVERLYPIYRELAGEDGAIYGVPVYADAYNGWFINKEVMTAMGLTEEDIPTSLTELCAFATRWNDEFAEKYPHYTLINNTTSYRERLLEAILDAWEGYCQRQGLALDYSDPVLRQALDALDAAHLDQLDAGLRQTDPEVSEYKQALIWTGIRTVGNWATYMEDCSDRIFIPMTLTPETPYTVAVESTSLWAVNKDSDDAAYAVAMLELILQNLQQNREYVLCQDMTEPVENPGYAEMLANEQAYLASLESYLEESVNKEAAQKRIDDQRDYIANELEANRYQINPSAIENYRNVILPGAYIELDASLVPDEQAYIRDEYTEALAQGWMTVQEFVDAMQELGR